MTKETKAGRKPTHRLYQVLGEGDAASWREIGAGWEHNDQAGLSLTLDAIPLTGRLVIRAITEGGNGGQQ